MVHASNAEYLVDWDYTPDETGLVFKWQLDMLDDEERPTGLGFSYRVHLTKTEPDGEWKTVEERDNFDDVFTNKTSSILARQKIERFTLQQIIEGWDDIRPLFVINEPREEGDHVYLSYEARLDDEDTGGDLIWSFVKLLTGDEGARGSGAVCHYVTRTLSDPGNQWVFFMIDWELVGVPHESKYGYFRLHAESSWRAETGKWKLENYSIEPEQEGMDRFMIKMVTKRVREVIRLRQDELLSCDEERTMENGEKLKICRGIIRDKDLGQDICQNMASIVVQNELESHPSPMFAEPGDAVMEALISGARFHATAGINKACMTRGELRNYIKNDMYSQGDWRRAYSDLSLLYKDALKGCTVARLGWWGKKEARACDRIFAHWFNEFGPQWEKVLDVVDTLFLRRWIWSFHFRKYQQLATKIRESGKYDWEMAEAWFILPSGLFEIDWKELEADEWIPEVQGMLRQMITFYAVRDGKPSSYPSNLFGSNGPREWGDLVERCHAWTFVTATTPHEAGLLPSDKEPGWNPHSLSQQQNIEEWNRNIEMIEPMEF